MEIEGCTFHNLTPAVRLPRLRRQAIAVLELKPRQSARLKSTMCLQAQFFERHLELTYPQKWETLRG